MIQMLDPIAPDLPALDAKAEVARITGFLRRAVSRGLNRRGVVVGISGGIDSAVCAALATAALGPERVLGLLMPERECGDGGTRRARDLCRRLGLDPVVEDITEPLAALGCYRRRDDAVRRLFPGFGEGWKLKIAVAGGLLDQDRITWFDLIVESPDGARRRARMPAEVYRQVVAATNMKQRTRKQIEYYHADRLNYAVLGTPNRLEYELGFFVRGGDGLADLKPIAHLYKTQVYELAALLDVPEEIRRQPPSTDTYSLDQTQEEFYFALPYNRMDVLLHAYTARLPAHAVGRSLGLTETQVQRVYKDIEAKRRTARRSLQPALLAGPTALSGSGQPDSRARSS